MRFPRFPDPCFATVVAIVASLPLVAQTTREDDARFRRLFEQGRHAELAETLGRKLSESRPHPGHLLMAAETAYELERFEEAERRFAEALALDPTLIPLTVRRGATLVRLGRTDDARRHLSAFDAAPPRRRAAALFGLGLAAVADGDGAAARRCFEASLKLASEDAACAVRLAQLDLSEGHGDAALALADAVLARHPMHTAAAYVRARALVALHRTEEADVAAARHRALLSAHDRIAGLSASIGTSGTPSTVMITVARIHAEFGDRAGVVRWTGYVASDDPLFPQAMALRATIDTATRPTSRPVR